MVWSLRLHFANQRHGAGGHIGHGGRLLLHRRPRHGVDREGLVDLLGQFKHVGVVAKAGRNEEQRRPAAAAASRHRFTQRSLGGATIYPLGQLGQYRMVEDRLYRQGDALLTQLAGKTYRQQRMATELEEIVVAPYLANLEQLTPYPRQRRFGLP